MAEKRNTAPALSVAFINDRVTYDPATGLLLWRPRPNNPRWSGRHAGKTAGTTRAVVGDKRRHIVNLNRYNYPAQKIVYRLMTGEWPNTPVRPHDGDYLNLRWDNLNPAQLPDEVADEHTPLGIRMEQVEKKLDRLVQYIRHGNDTNTGKLDAILAKLEEYD